MEMLKLKKFQVTCSYCSRILKNPILLPCDHSICGEHLTERNVVKENKIKCKRCNQEFGVKNNEFKSNLYLNNLMGQSYFDEDEIRLKQELDGGDNNDSDSDDRPKLTMLDETD
jgi:hypothetical protein